MNKKRVAIICGGDSTEHEVSLVSASSIADAIDKEKYDVSVIFVDKKREWFLGDVDNLLMNTEDPKNLNFNTRITLVNGENQGYFIDVDSDKKIEVFDVIFPITHGAYGEDGCLQGILQTANIPFVGPSVLSSAVCMDKVIAKKLLNEGNIQNSKFVHFDISNKDSIYFNKIKEKLGLPLFIKPANCGSSIGINKAESKEEFESAVKEAFKYDNKILIEEFIDGKEIECSVLGNEKPIASDPGEIIVEGEDFYTYKNKYEDVNNTKIDVRADLPDDIRKKVKDLAVKTYKTLCCEGMSRVDFFLKENGEVYVNEVNTLPGFTSISMFPKMWEASGTKYPDLIDKLIDLAIERYKRDDAKSTSLNK